MVKVVALDAIPASTSLKNETLISIVLDETGSMSSVKTETINSLNEYISSQKNLNDSQSCKVNLYKFSETSSGFGFTSTTFRAVKTQAQKQANPNNIRTVYEHYDIQNVPELTSKDFVPSGMTNLYDAIGNTIARLDSITTDNQNVLVVIITDGYENSSVEYDVDSIKKLIEERQAKGWTFVYLGANQDAWAVGSKFGLSKGQTLSYSTSDMTGTMANLSTATSSYRMTRSVSSTEEKNFFKGDE